jgi:phosphoribosylformylglycinamidine cyclo-ligase
MEPTRFAAASNEKTYDPTKPFNNEIRKCIELTHPKEGPITVAPFGKRYVIKRDAEYWARYGANLLELSGTDGIGTKGLLHWQMGTEQNGAQDAFAMVVDDLIEGGFVPVMIQDHITMQEEDPGRIFKIVDALTRLAVKNAWKDPEGKSRPIIISGGETAIINTLKGFEVGITGTGYVMRGNEIRSAANVGDALIGIESSGVHSNGMTFLREEFFEKRGMLLGDRLPWGATVGEELTIPTNVYLPALKEMLACAARAGRAGDSVHGMVHITGGGLSKLKELMRDGDNMSMQVMGDHALKPQELFHFVHDEFGMSSERIYKTFNCGVGYVVAADWEFEQDALKILNRHFAADVIGYVEAGRRKVVIDSQFDNTKVEYY